MVRTLTIEELKETQEKLNEFTLENWKDKLTKAHFNVAILDELGELAGSGRQWKWWKHGNSPDCWNEKIELIDILHFYLSKIILTEHNNEMLLDTDTNTKSLIDNETGWFSHESLSEFAKIMLDDDVDVGYIYNIIDAVGMSIEEVMAIYTAKAELNFIRQESGYKDGSYVKVDDGIEDNQRLQIIVENFLNDDSLSLSDVKLNVRDEFFKKIK